MARHKGQQPRPMDRDTLHTRLADLRARERTLLRRAYAEAGLVVPTLAPFTWAESDIPYEELWATVQWTDEAADRIRAGEFRYISPEFDMDHTDPASGDKVGAALLAIGLVTRPFLKGMARVEDPGEDNASAIQVFSTGEWHHDWYGRITIEPRHLQEMLDNNDLLFSSVREESEHEPTQMVVDYNHQSLFGSPDESKAAGWVNELYRVTPKAERKAASEPPGMTFTDTPSSSHGGTTMQDERVRALLSLEEDAEVTTEHLHSALDALEARLAEATAPAPDPEPVAAAEPPADGLEELRRQAAEGAAAMRQLKERDAAEAVDKAFAAGKITAAQKPWATGYAMQDPQGFAAFVEGADVKVSTEKDAPREEDPAPGGVAEFIQAKVAEGTDRIKAMELARAQFGEDDFDAWRWPNR